MSAEAFLARVRPRIESALDDTLPPETQPPSVVHEAMRYTVFAGGKRLRPALCLAGFEVFNPEWSLALPVAAAIELVHTYSLIHDDLPAMDDDDFRRGQPSCHKRFGEAIAILAGDGLLTLAFHTVAGTPGIAPERLLHVTRMLAAAAGTVDGMIAGQVLDLEAEATGAGGSELEAIHQAKTGALLGASVAIGAYLGGADPAAMGPIVEYGRRVGLAFQIVDDILDEIAPVAMLGKTPGKDQRQGKATYPGVHGMGASRRTVRRITREARQAALELGPRGQLLSDLAAHLEQRVG